MKSGTGKVKIDHRDYDFHKSFNHALGSVPFPSSYNTDAGLTMPNQNTVNLNYNPAAPALPKGCTSYDATELAIDLGVPPTIISPMLVENITQSNARGGYDLRQALLAGVKAGLYDGIFNIQAKGQDMFDAVRDAQVSGGTQKRSVAIASKWLPDFENLITKNPDGTFTTQAYPQGWNGILPIPIDWYSPNLTYHAWKVCGWEMIGGQVYAVCKSWQGRGYGKGGLVYISRPLFNQLMSQSGAAAFVAYKGELPPIQTIDVTFLQWLISYARNLLPY